MRVITQYISCCRACPYHFESGGLVGEAEWCQHKLPSRMIGFPKDGIPDWCNLTRIEDTFEYREAKRIIRRFVGYPPDILQEAYKLMSEEERQQFDEFCDRIKLIIGEQ